MQGYKIHRGDGVARTAIGVVWHQAVALLFGLPVRDTDCDFRLIRRPVVQALPFESSSGVFPVELVWRLKTQGARFVEIPVHHYARAHGRSQFFRPLRILATFRDLGCCGGGWWRAVASTGDRSDRCRPTAPAVSSVGSRPIWSRSLRTSDSGKRRWPPNVRRDGRRPLSAQRLTVFGFTRNMRATSPGVSQRSA